MRIISRRTLRECWEKHSKARTGLILWYDRILKCTFNKFTELRELYPSADLVGNFTVFNINGNNYRLITYIDYEAHEDTTITDINNSFCRIFPDGLACKK